ncbi:MAG: hypothetical protein RBT68_11165 [Spirochaetia bacterium]|nr:hypothetical protein [Spirochaetia bacterium]
MRKCIFSTLFGSILILTSVTLSCVSTPRNDTDADNAAIEKVWDAYADGSTLRLVGKFLDILARQPDGSWKITRDCFNFDGPPVPVAK